MKKNYLKIASILFTFGISPAYASGYNNSQLQSFERTNSCINCDLSGASISYNHSGAVLEQSNLSDVNMYTSSTINFSSSNLKQVNFSGANLRYANFSQADLTGARFDGADIYGANFYGAKGVDFTNTRVCYVILPDGKNSGCDA
jgi:uncharacterized protein YjbI with pentapeptide repeats